jgi:FAD/FMN-containing dehydrogenase
MSASGPTIPSGNGPTSSLKSLNLEGRLVLPGEDAWEDARTVWNGMIDRHPVAVLQAATPDDVAKGIETARRHGLPLAVRGGGHNVAGNGTVGDGLVIDLSPMNDVGVNPGTRIVTVGGGATLGELDRGTMGHRTAVPAGVVSTTGVGGLTVGGGMGWLTRAYGLSIDNLLDIHVVTAEGAQVHASPQHNPELFWGVRGGGSNFGVVTKFEFQGVPLGPDVFAGGAFYLASKWQQALRFYAEWAQSIPDELTTIVTWMTPMAHWGFPDHLTGQPILAVTWCWAGRDMAEGERAVQDLTSTDPDSIDLGSTPWLDLQTGADDLFPKGVHAYFKSTYFDDFNDQVIEILAEHSLRRRSPIAGTDIHQLGGAFSRKAEDATAFGNRDAKYILNVWGVWNDAADDSAQIAWVRDFWDAMQPHSRGGHYTNFLGAEEGAELAAQTRGSYPTGTWDRLVALKNEWDPDNVFRLNHNIPPSGAS